MTKQEKTIEQLTIEQLERVSRNLATIGEREDYTDIAIKALEKEPCEDCVSRKAVLDLAGDSFLDLESYEDTKEFCNEIKDLPPVKPAPKKGKWVNKSHKNSCGVKIVVSECTCCGKNTFFDCDELLYRYCPNCGAKMDGGEE